MTATAKIQLTASAREQSGKGSARALRREGKVPAILYNKGGTPLSIALKSNELVQAYGHGRFRSKLVELSIDGKAVQALPKDLQFHPVTDAIEHVDFLRVEKGVPIRVMVPVKFTGQDKSLGLKRGGVLNVVRHEIEFTCAPEKIPTQIEIDVSGMDIGGNVHIADLSLPDGVAPVITRNFTVATIAGRKKEEEEVKPVAAAEDAAVPGAEGAAAAPGAEGAAAAPAAEAADAKKEGKK